MQLPACRCPREGAAAAAAAAQRVSITANATCRHTAAVLAIRRDKNTALFESMNVMTKTECEVSLKVLVVLVVLVVVLELCFPQKQARPLSVR